MLSLEKRDMDDEEMRNLAFFAGVADADDATATIRGMAHLESLLFELILRNLERPELIDPFMSLSGRIIWALALGEIGDKTADALRRLAKIRNELAHTHIVVFADDELIKKFIAAARLLPLGHAVDWKLPDDVKVLHDPPLTDLRWQMRMGISALSSVLNNAIVFPPKRTRKRPGPGEGRPGIHLFDNYEPQPPV
jgi:hypothetical protein